MKCVLYCLTSVSVLAQVSPVAFSDSREGVPAFDSSGTLTLPATRFKIDVTYPRSKKVERRELTVVYDPTSRLYLWNSFNPNPNIPEDGIRLKMINASQAMLFVDAAALVQFDFGDGLAAKVWHGRANNLDAAVSASLDEIRQGLAAFEGRGFHRDLKFVPIFGPLRGFEAKIPAGYNPISREFSCEPYQSFCPSTDSKIVSVSKQGNHWRLVLHNRFDVEVIVDQNLDLVSAQPLTQPKQ